MKIENKKHLDAIEMTTTEAVYVYYSTEWEYIECDEHYIYIKFIDEHPKSCTIYNKDQVISIEIG